MSNAEPAVASLPSSGTVVHSSLEVGTYELSWNFNEYDAETIANNFNMSQSWRVLDPSNEYDEKMQQVLSINPDYEFLIYRNMISIYSYWVEEWSYAESQGWLLKDLQGNYVAESDPATDYLVDITNSSYQQWVGRNVADWLEQHPSFAGVFVDNSLLYSYEDWVRGSNSTPINPATGSPFTTQQILDGCVDTLNAIIAAVGVDKTVVVNGIFTGFCFEMSTPTGINYQYILSNTPGLTGIMSEGPFYHSYTTKYYSVDQWQQSINMVQWIQDSFLSRNPANHYVTLVPVECPPIPYAETKYDLAMFGFCSLLLGIENSGQNFIGFGGSPSTMIEDPQVLSFVRQIKELNIGVPCGDYYQVESISLFARDFSNGLVLVNPSNVPLTYTADQNYDLMDGTAASTSLVINPHEGLVLIER
ncbi:MAG: putative glycoside hydrolase [Candidatus Bathyarchaeota archaeon]|nr:putative glycoside hydrolase [Candidatus Bathyarchaeota archaeon]